MPLLTVKVEIIGSSDDIVESLDYLADALSEITPASVQMIPPTAAEIEAATKED